MMDDVLVYGASVQEHDQPLTTVLDTLQNAGITLNKVFKAFCSVSWPFH